MNDNTTSRNKKTADLLTKENLTVTLNDVQKYKQNPPRI